MRPSLRPLSALSFLAPMVSRPGGAALAAGVLAAFSGPALAASFEFVPAPRSTSTGSTGSIR